MFSVRRHKVEESYAVTSHSESPILRAQMHLYSVCLYKGEAYVRQMPILISTNLPVCLLRASLYKPNQSLSQKSG